VSWAVPVVSGDALKKSAASAAIVPSLAAGVDKSSNGCERRQWRRRRAEEERADTLFVGE
jgi:hypothetical protein